MCAEGCDITIPKGETGEQGPQGLTGATGATGSTGAAGSNGSNGAAGTNALNYYGTTTTTIDLTTLTTTKTITISPIATAFQVGSRIRVSLTSSPSDNYFEGIVGSNNTGTGSIAIVAIDTIVGTANTNAWTVSIAGEKGLTVTTNVPVGTILDYVSTTAPAGYLILDGSVVPNGAGTVQGQSLNFSALYALVGTKFGSAGTIPDTRKRIIVGYNSGSAAVPVAPTLAGVGVENYGALGNLGGLVSNSLTKQQLPTHRHSMETGVDGGSSVIEIDPVAGSDTVLSVSAGTAVNIGNGSWSASSINLTSSGRILSGNTGNGATDLLAAAAVENRQPYIVLTQIIKV